MRRLCAQLISCLFIAAPWAAYAAGSPGYVATPDSCCVVDKIEEETVHLKRIGNCNGKPGRAFIQTNRKKVKVVVDGIFWKETDVEGLSVPDLADSLAKADRLAERMAIPKNRNEREMTNLAGTLDSYYHSDDFQLRLKSESERIKGELFGGATVKFYPDSKPTVIRGKLGNDERIYVFVSSSMPLSTIRNYAASVARLGDPNVVLVMRGFVEGMTKIQPTIRFIGSVLQRNLDCNPTEGECEMMPASLAVDPLLFRRYGIDRVPAVVYARGVKAEDAALSEGDSKNTSIGENHTVYGDARLEYLIEQIQRETGSRTLADLLTTSPRKN